MFDQVTSWQPVDGTNKVLNLDGIDDHVLVPPGTYFGSEFTLETWVFQRSYNYFSRILDFGNGFGLDNVLLVLSRETTGRPQFNIIPGAQLLLAPNPIPLNEWVHLAVTFRSNTATMFVNGAAVVSGTMTAPNGGVVRTNNFIGRSNSPPPDANANALVDDVRIWNVARTPQQLRQFSREPVSPDDPNLVLNYRFDEPSGAAVVDSRNTSTQHGTLVNGAGRQASLPVSVTLTNLAQGGVYHYLSLAQNANGPAASQAERFVTWSPGGGTALAFDGLNDHVRITDFGSRMPTNEVTVEFWQRVHSAKNQSTFALSPDTVGNRFQAHVPWSDGQVYWDFGGSRLQYVPPVSLVGTWQHFVLVSSRAGDFMRIYRNGVIEASKVGAGQFTRGIHELLIGRNNTLYFGGELDEFRVWNVARTPGQIQADTSGSLTGNEPGLVAYYRMDEGAGWTLVDATTNANYGLLVNGPLWVPSGIPASGAAYVVTNANTITFSGYQPVIKRIATPPVTNMVVSNLSGNITPAIGTPGVEFADGNAGLNLSLNYNNASNITYGPNASGLLVRSSGRNGASGASGDGDGDLGQPGFHAGNVSINSVGTIVTAGVGSHGIAGLSLGGWGG